jgi:hypothetical protein
MRGLPGESCDTRDPMVRQKLPDAVRRTKSIGVKATETEKAAWSAAARTDGRTLSQWIARRCNGESATPPVFTPPAAPLPPQPAQPAPVKHPPRRRGR